MKKTQSIRHAYINLVRDVVDQIEAGHLIDWKTKKAKVFRRSIVPPWPQGDNLMRSSSNQKEASQKKENQTGDKS